MPGTANVSIEELAKFEKMAADWWNPKGTSRPLHALNPTRLQFITDRVTVRGQKIVDIGCGGGILSESLAARGGFVTGIDLTPALLTVAKQHAAENQLSNLHYLERSAEQYAEEAPKSFDIVTCMELLEHVPCPLSLLKAAAHLLKPGGHLFLSTLNRTPKAYLLAIIGAEYVLRLLPRQTHSYEKFIRPSELSADLKQANLTLEELAGLHYNPFSHTCNLSQDVSVNYLAHARALDCNHDDSI